MHLLIGLVVNAVKPRLHAWRCTADKGKGWVGHMKSSALSVCVGLCRSFYAHVAYMWCCCYLFAHAGVGQATCTWLSVHGDVHAVVHLLQAATR